MEFDDILLNVDKLIFFTGLVLFVIWVCKTSLGRKSLSNSIPRRNNMPLYLPFVPFFICFGTIFVVSSIAKTVFGDLQKWQSDLLDNIIICIFELITIVLMNSL